MGTDRRYRYDAASRLVDSRETVNSVIHQQAPTYDAYGNIQALTTGPLSAPQTLMTPTSASTNRLTSFGTTYDWMGNMTRWVSGPAYDYDRLNRMRRFRASTLPGSEEWVFAYTADDERILSKRVVGGTDEIWTLRGPGGQVLREMRPNVSVHQLKDYVWTGRTMVARIERTPVGGKPPYTEETIHVATDHLDTPRWFTDSAGVAMNPRHFYPFGKEITAGANSDRYQFTGHERDGWSTASANDDLDYMHARHYNPQLGRFLQVDPLAGVPGRPQSLNRYAYVGGNPLNFSDPLGLIRCTATYRIDENGKSKLISYKCEDEVDAIVGGPDCNSPFNICLEPDVPLPGGDGPGPGNGGPDGVPGGQPDPNGGGNPDGPEDPPEEEPCTQLTPAEQRYIAAWNRPDPVLGSMLRQIADDAAWVPPAAKGLSEILLWTGVPGSALGSRGLRVTSWFSARSRGGGLRLLKDGVKVFGLDWNRFKLGSRMVNRPHFHAGGTRSQFDKHRPWQGGWCPKGKGK